MEFLLNPAQNVHLPKSPVASLLFALLVLMRKNQLSDSASETMMLFFNMVLLATNETYSFPSSACTFDAWCNSSVFCHDGIREYANCPTCHSMHPYNTEQEKQALHRQVTCFGKGLLPNAQPCMTDILKTNQYGTILPIRSFFYNSVIQTLKSFLMRETFVNDIKKWKSRRTVTGKLIDIYDGLVWKDFKVKKDDPKAFVDESDFNLLFTLNCDWFQGYKDSYSVGAVYMTIQNQPREVRNLRSNTILVCLINGPNEPSTFEMNNYLKPLVDDLLVLMNGIDMKTRNNGVQKVKAALSLCIMDLPAQKKVAGFTSFSSFHACHKCKKRFGELSGTGNHARDFTDFDDEDWVRRTCDEHREEAQVWRQAANKARRKELEDKNGTRWSVLLDLPYFDPIRHVAIDVMHNLLLGLTKKMVVCWTSKYVVNGVAKPPIFTKQVLQEMQKVLETKFLLPPSHAISSIARKMTVGNGFSNMKADEWATWLLVLSPYLLDGKLSPRQYKNWMLFVSAARVLLSPCLSVAELDEAHSNLQKFLKSIVPDYGDKTLITANCHYAMHVKETILDYSAAPNH